MTVELPGAEADRVSLANLVLAMRRRGVRDRRIYAAIELTPRRMFLPAEFMHEAFDDRPLPIECGQSICAPSLVGLMTQALDVREGDRVLEIGTGSGYHTAVLARLAEEVYSVERYRKLARLAQERFSVLRLGNISVRVEDGLNGWPEKAPFDRILVTGAAEAPPEALISQMRIGAIMVMPVGPSMGAQQLTRFERTAEGLKATSFATVRLVPLVPGTATRL
ncbi:protein-L-isoaspartate(D-aspartate) O-methyltransferase [Pseudoxanthobacter sp.]|uniref:protein-L-isoaspartate(D-aspartate) O-methyltransferase n=1 Tax=Pseudoxanthobacter sp. TaxID=1925742 RepID=UPI002FE08816